MEKGQRYVPDYENYDYLREWQRRDIEDAAEREMIRSWLPRAKYCLELGGGFGRITEILEPCAAEVVMVDFSKRNLSLASARLRKAMLLRSDVRGIPFADSAFDCIVVVRMLHHVDDLRAVLDAARKHCSAHFRLADLHCTVYLRHSADAARVLALLAQAMPGALPPRCVQADICRAELLVEIEAHAFAPGALA